MDFKGFIRKVTSFIVYSSVTFCLAILCQSSYSSENRLRPSFDCEKASTKIEKAICGDSNLSALDRGLNNIYRAKMAIPAIRDSVKKSQLDWLRVEREKCERVEGDKSKGEDSIRISCLDSAYRKRREVLFLLKADPSDALSYPPIKFKLMAGNQYPLCRDYVDMLNKSTYRMAPICDRNIISGFSKFRPVEWVEITDKEEIKKIRKEQIMMEFLWPADSQEKAEKFWLWKESEMNAGEWPVLHKARIDMDHDGQEDTVYRFSMQNAVKKKYGRCETMDSYFVKFDEPGKTESIYSKPGGYGSRLQNGGGGVRLFYYDGRAFQDYWNSWISEYHIKVNEISGISSQVCGVNMVQ